MRKLRSAVRNSHPAALLAAGLATAALGLVGVVSNADGAGAAGTDRPAPTTTVTAYDIRTGGAAEPRGDDNRDGRIDEDESGWNCHTMGNEVCGPRSVPAECEGAGSAAGLCVTVALRPAYAWTNPDGSHVSIPDGRAQLRDLDETPGTPPFTAALRALDTEWRAHH
ncbi:hypothetical protein OG413_20580 [Streptomyces sp. NBC_01433]|uniref:hypothetical protein n=1 Tax=Streptomyces sp. NBC_01433 TaxID=2903864 RepID=UPI00225B6406|nr:hypothetical protein [Streptomyces sp. NBC_01433]MCX4677671.1 hypothetical protein [Streptomyces sp. NBC_01433]